MTIQTTMPMTQLEDKARKYTVVVADDDPVFCKQVTRIIEPEVDAIRICHSGKQVFDIVANEKVELVLLDLHLPDIHGLKILEMLKAANSDTEVVIITGHSTIDTAVAAIQQGAGNYLCKPVKRHDLLIAVQSAREKVMLRRENRWLRESLDSHEQSDGIIGQSPAVAELRKTIRKVAPLDCNVLIQGGTGTGKQLVARAVYQRSNRRDRQFVTFNCGGFAEELIANELFGHEKGAFTGATSTKAGLLESGNGGTVFLDEIGEMSLSMQAKLLHVIEEKRIFRLGSTTPIDLDIRIIAATNRHLREISRQGTFREDLYYRLNVVNIELPPLARRMEDLPLLINHFVNVYNRQFGKNISSVSPEAMEILMSYDYPGNIRELENILQRGLALSEGGTICAHHLPEDIKHFSFASPDHHSLQSLADLEKEHIKRVLKFTGGDRKLTAAILGLPRTTLWRRIKQYRLDQG
ncbi:MAG: sigma-54-dependent transcriptional regulator [Desulforhopalus sp.]